MGKTIAGIGSSGSAVRSCVERLAWSCINLTAGFEHHDERCRVSRIVRNSLQAEVLPIYCFELEIHRLECLRLFLSVVFTASTDWNAGVAGVHGFCFSACNGMTLDHLLKDIRVAFIPLVNPSGMLRRRRSNAQGVDLMRNAPIDAKGKSLSCWGASGFTLFAMVSWQAWPSMQDENQALYEFMQTALKESPFVIYARLPFRLWAS